MLSDVVGCLYGLHICSICMFTDRIQVACKLDTLQVAGRVENKSKFAIRPEAVGRLTDQRCNISSS
jgi:hypothetical protein